MSGWKGGSLLLVLAVPLALYAAWSIQGVVRTDMVVSDAPAERGKSKDELAALKTKTAGWAGDARKTTNVALQYRQPAGGDRVADPVAGEVVRAAAARAAELSDLDQFLAGVPNPDFKGKMVESYKQWKDDLRQVQNNEKEIDRFLDRAPPTSVAEAANLMSDLEKRLADYQQLNFANRARVTEWRVRARLVVVKGLGALADARHEAAVKEPLPFRADSDAVKDARSTFAAIKTHVAALNADVQRAEAEKTDLSGLTRDIENRRAIGDKCGKREQLLILFTRDNLFKNAGGAAAWLREVAVLYRDTKDATDRETIRDKVQEFCGAFVPAAVRLDDEVLIRGKPARREALAIEYKDGGATKETPLTGDPAGLNEFTAATTYPGGTTFVLVSGNQEYLKNMEPTELSKAARRYTELRRAVGQGATGPKWTVKTVEELKKKCEAEKELVDNLKKLKALRDRDRFPNPKKKDAGADKDDDELNILVRIESVLDGLRSCTELLDGP